MTVATPEVSRPFIGRDREIGALMEGLDEVLRGRGRLFLVAGEPGIGKSRLADEFAARARDRGAMVLWGRCWEAGGAPPFWPWVQILRAYVRARDLDEIRAEVGLGAVDVAQILPELRQMFAGLPEPPAVDPESARFQLFDSTASFVANASAAHPLVLVLEDLHAADEPSLLLLRFLSGQIGTARLLVVGTYRDVELTPSHPLTTAAAEIGRDPATRQLALRGLTEEDVERFVATTAGTPPPGLAAALHRETNGNPLFLGEAVRLLADEGGAAEQLDPARLRVAVPQSVREVIGRRIDHLDEHSREVLSLASVLGTEFGADDLRRLSEVTAEALNDLLDRLSAAGLIAQAPGGLGKFRFSHELIRETLYRALTTTNRMRLHRRAAEVLASSTSGGDSHLAELAHHYFEAAPLGDAATAVDFARRAAEEAARSLAYEEASRLYAMAVQALELGGEADQHALVALLFALGDVQARSGNLPGARETFLRVATAARRSGDAIELGNAALGYGGRFPWARVGDDPHLIPMLQDALMLLGGDDDRLRVRLLSRLSCALRSSPDRERNDSLSRQALEIARALGDPSTLCYALSCRCWAIWWPENPRERLDLATELIGLAEEAGDMERLFEAHVARSAFLLDIGAIVEARAEWEAMARRARQFRQPAQSWPVRTWETLFALLVGDFRRAEVLLASEAPPGQRWTTVRDEDSAAHLHRFLLLRELGGLADIEDAARSAVGEFPWYPLHRAALACLLIELDRGREARGVFDDFAADRFRIFYPDSEWLLGMALASEAAARLGDEEAASVLYERLAPFAGAHALGLAEGSVGATDRYLGLLASCMGRSTDADLHFEQAVALNDRMGAAPWAAHSRHDWARTLIGRDGPGDRERAAGLLAEAGRTAADHGMVVLEQRIREASAAMDEPAGPGSARPVATVRPSVFRREGEYWSITFEAESFRLRDSKGLRYLAVLLASPGREIHALELVGADRRGSSEPRDGHMVVEGDTGEVLDAEAKAAYRRRIEELEAEVQQAREWNDAGRAAKAEEELEFLVDQLAGAVGLGGRDRKPGSSAERARVNVTRAIRSALDRIEEHSPALGRHLASTIRTGLYCSYAPDPRVPATWQL